MITEDKLQKMIDEKELIMREKRKVDVLLHDAIENYICPNCSGELVLDKNILRRVFSFRASLVCNSCQSRFDDQYRGGCD